MMIELKEKDYYSNEHLKFLNTQKKKKYIIRSFQFGIIIFSLIIWELCALMNWLDPFLFSSPLRVMQTIINLNNNGELWSNIGITMYETIIGFILGTTIGISLAIVLWWSNLISDITEPYLVVLNALPKVALGPIIIVWVGAGMGSIIVMALLISTIISIINILSGFRNVSPEKILLMKSFGATKFQILQKVIFPYNIPNMISTLKINVGMSLIGVITGEFLVATKGIGYLIIYGGQVFKLDLVMTGIFILSTLAAIIYVFVAKLESIFNKKET